MKNDIGLQTNKISNIKYKLDRYNYTRHGENNCKQRRRTRMTKARMTTKAMATMMTTLATRCSITTHEEPGAARRSQEGGARRST